MSLAQQSGPGRAPDVVRRLRWALAATGLALVVVLALLVATLLAMRRVALRPPVAEQNRIAAPQRRNGAAAPVERSALAETHASPSKHAAGPGRAGRPARPRVVIVERRVAAPPVPPVARLPEPLRPLAVPPRPQRVLGARWTLKAQTSPPPAPAIKLPLISLPPDEDARDIAAPESPPEPIAQPTARYPEDAAAEGVTGTVRLKVIVGARGRVEDAVVVRSSGDDRLDQAAEAAVRRWRYRPARRNGQAVSAVDYAVVDFYREDAHPGRQD